MALVPMNSSPFTIDSTNGTNQYLLGNGSVVLPSTHVIQLVGAAWSGSIVVKARVTGSGLAFTAIPYVRRTLAGVASDDTPVIAALTTDFTIKVDSTGLDLVLDTTYTSGSAKLGVRILTGPDA